jgi:phosphoribosylaminoimidazolecarboxamide formyltransferase / IMP cyclohydrolase
MLKLKRAVLSVYNKEGIVDLGLFLSNNGVEILSTGGTAKILREAGIQVIDISTHTGFPEILEGRVKTLHPIVHGGILAKGTPDHLNTLKKHNIAPIDLVVVNLYPFTETINKPDISMDQAIEMIDIGGPTMIRAAAKNYERVSVLCDPTDYNEYIKMAKSGEISLSTRLVWAQKVFNHTATYDNTIANYLSNQL